MPPTRRSRRLATPSHLLLLKSSIQRTKSIVIIDDREVSVPTGIFVKNEFRKSLSGAKFGIENQATGKKNCSNRIRVQKRYE